MIQRARMHAVVMLNVGMCILGKRFDKKFKKPQVSFADGTSMDSGQVNK